MEDMAADLQDDFADSQDDVADSREEALLQLYICNGIDEEFLRDAVTPVDGRLSKHHHRHKARYALSLRTGNSPRSMIYHQQQ